VAAQLGGAVAAAYALRLVALPGGLAQAGAPGLLALAPGVTRLPALLAEAAMTFLLVLAVFTTTVDKPRVRWWLAGLAAAMVIVAASLAGGAMTGAAVNPARAFGPALAARQWAYQGVYWVGPLAGGVAAAVLYDLLLRIGTARLRATEAQSSRP
jgi:aquaporin Z